MRELFIYYRVRAEQAEALRVAVNELHRALKQRHPALNVRLLHRAEAPLDTWMEIFSTDPLQAPEGVSTALQATIEREAAAFASRIEGVRHTEVFFACAS